MITKRIKKFFNRPDVRQNPLKALFKRLKWRIHWIVSDRPYAIPFAENLTINLPKSGSASLIYYQGLSEFETADFVMQFLQPGMTFFDIGAHIGEYTLLAAKLVGDRGKVYAFEPQPSLFPVLRKNVQQNGLDQVTLNQSAVSDRPGSIEFEVVSEPSVSSIRKNSSVSNNSEFIQVNATCLDDIWSTNTAKIDLIKVDVEGAEKFVFDGAKELMKLSPSQAPTWIFEYAPTAYSMFNYQAKDLLNLLQTHGYQVYRYMELGKIRDFSPERDCKGIINLIATKDIARLENFSFQAS